MITPGAFEFRATHLEAVYVLPAVHLPVGLLGLHRQGALHHHCHLPDVRKGDQVGGLGVKVGHLDHRAHHERQLGLVGRRVELGVADVGTDDAT